MTIRQATDKDLYRIWELGAVFGHLMDYMRSEKDLQPFIDEIIVHEDTDETGKTFIDGFYHCKPLKTLRDKEEIQRIKVIPDFLMDAAHYRSMQQRKLGICMQGGSHREAFYEMIAYLQTQYDELWCWCSIKSSRPKGYMKLGFTFNPKVKYKFWNYHKDGESTYQLGRWVK